MYISFNDNYCVLTPNRKQQREREREREFVVSITRTCLGNQFMLQTVSFCHSFVQIHILSLRIMLSYPLLLISVI